MNLEEWTSQLREDVGAGTKELLTNHPIETMASRVALLIEAKESLLKRWKGQRLNRRPIKKIAKLDQAMEEHHKTLPKEEWDKVGNSIDGPMIKVGTSNILKHLLGVTNTKRNLRDTLSKVMHVAQNDSTKLEIIAQLLNR